MLGNCARCGPSSTSTQDSQAYRWRCHVREAEARLNLAAAEASRLWMSYGNYMAAIYDGRIERAGGWTEP